MNRAPAQVGGDDALGNRLNNNAQYDAANRLLEDDDHDYRYDINGNRIEKVDKASGEVERYMAYLMNK